MERRLSLKDAQTQTEVTCYSFLCRRLVFVLVNERDLFLFPGEGAN